MRLEGLLGVALERLISPGVYVLCKPGIIFVNIWLVDQTNTYINIHVWLNILRLCWGVPLQQLGFTFYGIDKATQFAFSSVSAFAGVSVMNPLLFSPLT